MYDHIIDLAMDQQFLTEIKTRSTTYKRLPVWRELHSKTEEEIQTLEEQLSKDGLLKFDTLFAEPIGYYFIKSYLELQHSVDKAIFVRDVDIFKTLNDPIALKEVAFKIYDTFCIPESSNRVKGTSVFKDTQLVIAANKSQSHPSKSNESALLKYELSQFSAADDSEYTHQTISEPPSHYSHTTDTTQSQSRTDLSKPITPETTVSKPIPSKSDNSEIVSSSKHFMSPNSKTVSTYTSLFSDDTNAIGCYGKPVKKLKERIAADDFDIHMFDQVVHQIASDLKLDVFPRFLKSPMFDMYLRCKSLELKEITMDSFHHMRMLGRGAFGAVSACKKKDTGRLYAMKQIDKRRVQATDSVRSLIAEKEFLSKMDSKFVTSLKYAFVDEDKLYLIMDLMTGGDLKYHLNHDSAFEENRTRFYCAQILLGLEHIHNKGIIYRDLKLENVLVNEEGNIKISDLGLAVSLSEGLVRGYAGTPGYTAPEVVLTQYYSKQVDFFSFGVVIYRSICGKKPFAKNRLKTNEMRLNDKERLRKTSIELDRNVVEMTPPFDSSLFNPIVTNLCRGLLNKHSGNRLGVNGFYEIKEHPWFDCIDWGLLEAGYLKAPFIPACDEIHAEQQQHIGRPPDDDKYSKIKLTQEFETSLDQFTFKSSKVIQYELVDVLQKVRIERRQENKEDNCDLEKLYAFPQPDQVVAKRQCLDGCIIV